MVQQEHINNLIYHHFLEDSFDPFLTSMNNFGKMYALYSEKHFIYDFSKIIDINEATVSNNSPGYDTYFYTNHKNIIRVQTKLKGCRGKDYWKQSIMFETTRRLYGVRTYCV
jgi:hypothetical protein